jgi:hypothetical protein
MLACSSTGRRSGGGFAPDRDPRIALERLISRGLARSCAAPRPQCREAEPQPDEVVVTPGATVVEVVVLVVDVDVLGGLVTVVDVVAGGTVDGTIDGTVVGDRAGCGSVDVVVVVGATPVSGDTHPAGGAVGPVCPGISTVPAHPKSENVDQLVVVEPSEKCATEWVSRIYPEASMETCTVDPV